MKKGFFLFTLIFYVYSSIAAELKSIDFKQAGEVSKLELFFNSNEVIAEKFHITEDKQIIVDLKGVKASERAMRAFDTSEFKGSIVFVSAYKRPDSEDEVRVAIQLRDNVRSVLKRKENRIVLEVENRFGVFSQNDLEDNKYFEEKVTNDGTTPSGVSLANLNVPKSDSLEDILENVTMSGKKKYIGKKISFNVKNVSVSNILNMISEVSGFNIILTDDVKDLPEITLSLTNIPWDQALDTILGLNKLVATKNGSILIIKSLAKATEDMKLENQAKKIAIKKEPLITKIFPISYAKTGDIKKIIEPYMTRGDGKISEDERTNNLIIQDTSEVIEKIRKIIEVLDTQTPQILIESKIVEVNESYAKEIGLRQGVSFGYDPIGSTPATKSTVGTGELGTASGPGFAFSSAPTAGTDGRNFFSFTVANFSRLYNLNFTLQLMESESKGKVISSPRVITQNKEAAELASSTTTSFQVTSGTGDTATTSFAEVSAAITLKVTPQVTNEGSIAMEVDIGKSQFGTRPSPGAPPNTTTRAVKTNVLVDNGSTIVIGGIYQYETLESHSGIPFLKDIPLLGWLFRTPYAPETSKSEMMIFITPRIINQEEAGLVDNG